MKLVLQFDNLDVNLFRGISAKEVFIGIPGELIHFAYNVASCNMGPPGYS